MSEKKQVGILFHHPGNGSLNNLDFREIINYSEKLENVSVVWDWENIPQWDLKYFETQIKKYKINKIILAGYDTGFIKSFIARVFTNLGLLVDNITQADFRENIIMNGISTQLAKTLIISTLNDIPFEEIISSEELNVCPDTLVIGGGIAGIQASLEIANSNQNVFLVEKSGTIGGHMAMFDKTFPTLDCAACILTPKMVEVGQHSNIELLTYSEVQSVEGVPGNYKVKILKKARRVDLAKCIGCGTCSERCPTKTFSEFDVGTTLRKAIYIPFPQAVPNKYLIDENICRYVLEKKCGVCVKVCPVPDCINLDAQDELIEINVGNIIVATGFKIFDAKKAEQYGYGKYPNVLTSLEFERLVNASGPTGGNITFRTKDKKGNWVFTSGGDIPDSIAIIHCIGSRDENHNKYCSKVCCMYSLKLAHLVKEKLPDTVVYEHFIDMRAFGKGYEEFYERIKNEGINIIRGKTATVKSDNGELVVRSEDIENGKLIEQKVEMVILAVGLEPNDDSGNIARMLGIQTDEYGWLSEIHQISDPVDTTIGGVTIAGLCQGPKDIPDTVAQASAAASQVLQSIVKGKILKGRSGLDHSELEKSIEHINKD